jgi:hypothetical protein
VQAFSAKPGSKIFSGHRRRLPGGRMPLSARLAKLCGNAFAVSFLKKAPKPEKNPAEGSG